ncbi:MAG: hypothetical protein K8R74_17710 [Bacteroidales bacterium]|nr:hypothetical protein [Bacteroidales bacterium]
MYFRIVILFGIILIPFALSAQNNSNGKTTKDYRNFKETLEKEIENNEQDTAQSKFQVLHPVKLPDWIFNLPASDRNTIYSIGISDPGMEEEKAFKLAELRAKVILSALIHSKVTFIIDNYSNERVANNWDEFTTRYENLFSILSSFSATASNFEIINEYFTSFGEAIVLIKHSRKISNDQADHIQLEINSYEVERQKYNKFEIEEKFELTGSLSSPKSEASGNNFFYSFHSLNNLFEISSKYQEEDYRFPYYNFKYQGQSSEDLPLFETSINNKLNYGLWKAFIETLVQKIFNMSLDFAVDIKRVGDDYTSETQDFSREVSEANMSFKINKFIIFNNRLSVELDYMDKQY